MKILIISYYSKPLNGVSSYRIESFCKEFTKLGADITLLTRHWDESFKSWDDLISSSKKAKYITTKNGYREIRVPFSSNNINRLSSLTTLLNYLTGNLHFEIDCYKNFKKEALNLLKNENDFDLVFVSSPPNNLVRLAHYLNKKTRTPFVVDFRDFFNFNYLIKGSDIKLNDKIVHQLSIFHLKRWLKNCSQIITVSPKLVDVCGETFGVKTSLFPNGFEAERFKQKEKNYIRNKVFTLRYLGTAYEQQNFNIIIKGLKLFQEKHPDKMFKIELIGLHAEKIERLFTSQFNQSNLIIQTQRIPKKEVVEKAINTDVLMLPWNNFESVYGTKVFDYIASGSHILLCPPDYDVVEELMKEYKNSSICSTPEEVSKTIQIQYNKWVSGTNKDFSHDFKSFSREIIAQNLYAEIRKS